MGDYKTDWWWNHVGKYQGDKGKKEGSKQESESAAVGANVDAETEDSDETPAETDSAETPVTNSQVPVTSCTWADVSAETIEHIKFAYGDDFESLGYSPEPPPGPLDLAGKDNSGMTALHRAAAGGHAAVCELLVDRGAEVNDKDKEC